jgi:hypothetical protein
MYESSNSDISTFQNTSSGVPRIRHDDVANIEQVKRVEVKQSRYRPGVAQRVPGS